MKTVNTRNILLILCTVVAFSLEIEAQEKTSKLEGWKPYTPSRLEWLAVELNATCNVPFSKDPGYSLALIPIEKEDAIMIYVNYFPNVNREIMNINIDYVRDIIAIKTESYGWSTWLKVKEQIQVVK